MQLKRNAEDLLEILQAIALATDNLQGSRCKIADVVCSIKYLKNTLQPIMNENAEVRDIF